MANAEQLALIRGGVEPWNGWREKNPDAHVDLTEADLVRMYLYEANLAGADLRRADVSYADLGLADLRGTNLTNAKLVSATFEAKDRSDFFPHA
jgi:uncharacterized protein YjbI with pentapeptide repeats